MSKKYELTPDFCSLPDATLFRIKALRDFRDEYDVPVKAGDLGGYVEGYHNLSHEGDCWVADNAKVSGKSVVEGDSLVCDAAEVWGDCMVRDSLVQDEARVYGNVQLLDGVEVTDVSRVEGNAYIQGEVVLAYGSVVMGDAHIISTDCVYGVKLLHCFVGDQVQLSSPLRLTDCLLSGTTVIQLSDEDENLLAITNACFTGDALIRSEADYLVAGPFDHVRFEKGKDQASVEIVSAITKEEAWDIYKDETRPIFTFYKTCDPNVIAVSSEPHRFEEHIITADTIIRDKMFYWACSLAARKFNILSEQLLCQVQ
jgi:carbonic anhydrase/acetyltransferase-like protein (isoleucine patch superfamily)